tara:strand:- start:10 stop:459 length:450 start_codon:yes stop_codon:yes gene_type:complete
MIDKNVWGKDMWHSIHFVALGYTSNPSNADKTNYKNFYENLVNIIPCQECSEHLKETLNELPIDNYLVSREKLFEWTVLLHNKVNKLLGKKEWSVKEAYNYYNDPHFNFKNNNKCFNNYYFFISILLFIIIIALIYKDKPILKKFLKKK